MNLIARYGRFKWLAENEDAGPYFLSSSRLHVAVSFGTRSLYVEKHGHQNQQQQFDISRAAFNAIRETIDLEASDMPCDQADHVIRFAARAARQAWQRWWVDLTRGGSVYVAFQNDTTRRLETLLTARTVNQIRQESIR